MTDIIELVKKSIPFAVIAGCCYMICIVLLYVDAARDHLQNADYAIVPGNTVHRDGTPSARLKARLDAAVELYRAGTVGKVIASGGVGKEGYDEAVVMAEYLKSKQVPDSVIVIDSKGTTTHATAVNAAKIIGCSHTVIAVTQRYHVSRSKLALRKAGFSKVGGYYPDFFELRDIYGAFREVPAWIKYFMM